MTAEDKLDALLARHLRGEALRSELEQAAATRVLAGLAQPLPRQRHSWRLWPSELLDWNFAPAWPRVAALAACAALGFAVGVAEPMWSGHAAPIVIAQNGDGGLVSVLSAPEPLSGVAP
jgi:hypothetical protein